MQRKNCNPILGWLERKMMEIQTLQVIPDLCIKLKLKRTDQAKMLWVYSDFYCLINK